MHLDKSGLLSKNTKSYIDKTINTHTWEGKYKFNLLDYISLPKLTGNGTKTNLAALPSLLNPENGSITYLITQSIPTS